MYMFDKYCQTMSYYVLFQFYMMLVCSACQAYQVCSGILIVQGGVATSESGASKF